VPESGKKEAVFARGSGRSLRHRHTATEVNLDGLGTLPVDPLTPEAELHRARS
jgi:hypothetical protein